MNDPVSLAELKHRAAGRPAPAEIATLYHRAFIEYGTEALWSRRASAHPTIAQALVVAESLRREGGMRCRPLMRQIEAACRAAL